MALSSVDRPAVWLVAIEGRIERSLTTISLPGHSTPEDAIREAALKHDVAEATRAFAVPLESLPWRDVEIVTTITVDGAPPPPPPEVSKTPAMERYG